MIGSRVESIRFLKTSVSRMVLGLLIILAAATAGCQMTPRGSTECFKNMEDIKKAVISTNEHDSKRMETLNLNVLYMGDGHHAGLLSSMPTCKAGGTYSIIYTGDQNYTLKIKCSAHGEGSDSY